MIADSLARVIFGSALLILSILSLIGLIFLTPIGFGKKTYAQLSSGQQTTIKVFLVLTWLSIFISVLSSLWVIFS